MSAKHAAAESALMSFVKPPLSKHEKGTEEDNSAWKAIASFAVFKLFTGWKEGKVGIDIKSSDYTGRGAMFEYVFSYVENQSRFSPS